LRYLINKKSVRIWQNEEKTKILKKLFDQLGERYKDRLGGYSRIVRLEPRLGDNAPRVIFSLV
jgi:large subunit ribosomal protein L17